MNISDLSPAARIAVLKEAWSGLSDADLLQAIGDAADEFAKGSNNSAGYYFGWILQQVGIKVARPYSFKCSCGRSHSVNK